MSAEERAEATPRRTIVVRAIRANPNLARFRSITVTSCRLDGLDNGYPAIWGSPSRMRSSVNSKPITSEDDTSYNDFRGGFYKKMGSSREAKSRGPRLPGWKAGGSLASRHYGSERSPRVMDSQRPARRRRQYEPATNNPPPRAVSTRLAGSGTAGAIELSVVPNRA